jgi:hypothetical protein
MQPDIEIYIKHIEATKLAECLGQLFNHTELEKLTQTNFDAGRACTVFVETEANRIEVFINPHAAGKLYCSVWFRSAHTGWENDLACAEAFFKCLDHEIRCSSTTWTESEVEGAEKWWVLTKDEKKLVPWR